MTGRPGSDETHAHHHQARGEGHSLGSEKYSAAAAASAMMRTVKPVGDHYCREQRNNLERSGLLSVADINPTRHDYEGLTTVE